MEGEAASLRKAAPHWSLAGDKQLLGVLQKIHQKIITKCEEANVKLDAMVEALDNASIDLQNVNNKFMALSNSQFVESRVYDDDVDVSIQENMAKAEPVKVEVESELKKMKRSLQLLEQMHEPVHILDSDSSDEEDDGRIILKPKEIYSHRPLPYIIGSQAWKSKWHAGLIQEESDSDSSISKQDNVPAEEYSESEPETAPTDKLANRTISSSSMESEVISQKTASQATSQAAKPADIAAELARRLGGQTVHLPASEPVAIETPPEPTTNKVYRVEKPAPTTIFADEPPPLDDYQSYKSDYTDEDDIFAELHKKPDPNTNRGQNRVAKDLFGGLNDNIVDDLFGEEDGRDTDIGNVVDYQDVKTNSSVREKTPLLEDRLESNSIAKKPVLQQKPIETKSGTESTIKKPIGAISLFGTNKGAESIGAAILKLNQRKSSSDEETNNTTANKEQVESVLKVKEEPVNKIIEDLFNKPLKKASRKEDLLKTEESEKVKPVKDKVDLFSDNLFDDIDDIFTTNVVTKSKDNKNQKSIFDDDDLFADITFKKPEKLNDEKDTKSIFDSDDDLFIENKGTLKTEVNISSNPINIDKNDVSIKQNVVAANSDITVKENETVSKNSKSIFGDDSEDDLFSDIKTVNEISKPLNPHDVKEENLNTITNNDESSRIKNVTDDSLLNKNENILSNNSNSEKLKDMAYSKTQCNSPSVIDDKEFDELFSVETNLINDQSDLNNINKNKQIIEETVNDKTIHTKVNPLSIKKTLQNNLEQDMQIKNEGLESNDINAKDKVVPGEKNISYIPCNIEKFNSQTDIPASNRRQDAIPPFISDVEDLSPKLDQLGQSKTLRQDVNNTGPLGTSIPEVIPSDSHESSLFNDVFTDMPPVFEKPLEPKKSRNVNALFDDDSEDEALFFKKNEVVSDEKPDLDYSGDRFRIFHDEPPEIDIDFSQKPLKNTYNSFSTIPENELFGETHGLHEQDADKYNSKDSKSEVKEPHQNIDFSKGNKINVDITKLIEDYKDSDEDHEIISSTDLESHEANDNYVENNKVLISKTKVTEDVTDKLKVNETETIVDKNRKEDTEPKKSIGKLKPMNFNLNVNTLLPGATLKKSKANEEIDGQTISTQSNEELNLHSPEKMETKMVKSVSFDGDPESEILDNKFSKQRAKIQVKRRPSSRKARLEAVRKSGVDFASDSTDNSSSFDEPFSKEIVNEKILGNVVDSTIVTPGQSTSSDTFNENTYDYLTTSLSKTVQKQIDYSIDTQTTATDVKSKVVYILNDEDIFSNINPRNEDNTDNKNVDIVDDNAELLFKAPNISTLGKTYENRTVFTSDFKIEPGTSISKESERRSDKTENDKSSKTNKAIFNDLSDDDTKLFCNKKAPIQKKNIFDSDSDEGELFFTGKRTSTVEVKKQTVKGSLFGDESDDENDLFSVKSAKKSENIKQNISKSKEMAATTSELVFEDPLSMFGDDS